MKTKSLLLTALLATAGTTGAMAQVYSLNIVGYVNQTIPAGFSMIADQLAASPTNTLAVILPTPPENTTVYKFKTTGGYLSSQFVDGEWSNPGLTLNPGEGAFIFAQTAFTNTFVGQLNLNSSTAVNQGFNIYSSAIPQAGKLQTDLGFVPSENDSIYQYKSTGGYNSAQFVDGEWTVEPTIKVGEAFWVSSGTASHAAWSRNFSVGP